MRTKGIAKLFALARRLAVQDGGNITLIFSLAFPVVAGLAGLAVDSASFYNQQSRMQSVADSSALAIAKEMHLFAEDTAALKEAGDTRIEALLAEVGLAERPHEAEVRLDSKEGHAEVEISMIAKSFLPADVWGENPIVVRSGRAIIAAD